ncbi:IS630 family transposase [Actinoplanes sp. TFC3]|uniref:IS630 family transposase n=1 Tax=Actinoplanes sp. TFC3 TaxID=1710355 RepID=UPI000A4DD5B2|nr:IS630 family transposase [Actinoplanes sp. TFC3]
MGRRPEVFVRALSLAEGQRLQKITRTAKNPVKLRRAVVVLMSVQGQPAGDIAYLLKATDDYVRDVIHAFNERGFDALDPKGRGGTPNKVSETVRDWICVIARCDPRFLGRPFSGWSLSKLRDYLIDTGWVATISIETVRRILHERGVTWQQSKTWKASNDLEFTAKMRRVLDRYDHPPASGRVICVDEFGTLNLQPRPGKAWKPQGRPVRLRATYHRDHGVRHMIANLDLATGKIPYQIRDRKRSSEFLAFLNSLRRRWPGQTMHLIRDNFSPHKHPTVRAWCQANDLLININHLEKTVHQLCHCFVVRNVHYFLRHRQRRANPSSQFARYFEHDLRSYRTKATQPPTTTAQSHIWLLTHAARQKRRQ